MGGIKSNQHDHESCNYRSYIIGSDKEILSA